MHPLVSVVIPTYNRWPVLCEAIESVLRQGFKDFELIVVDDGSEDGTVGNLMKCFSNLRVLSQPRRGVAAARNLGVRCSSGRYVAFLDSDDLWRSKKLEAQAGFMMFALVALNNKASEGLIFYTAAYCLATIGVFAILIKMKDYLQTGGYIYD